MITIEQLLKFILTNKISWLVVRDKQDTPVFRTSNENNTPEIVKNQVIDFLNEYSIDDFITVEAREHSKTPTAYLLKWKIKEMKPVYEVEPKTLNPSLTMQPQQTVIQGVPLDEVDKRIKQALEIQDQKYKQEQREIEYRDKKKELDLQLNELKQWSGKLSIVGNHLIDNLLKSSKLSGILAGLPSENNNPSLEIKHDESDLSDEENERLNKCVDSLLLVFTIEEIEKLTSAINTSNKDMILAFLK